MRLLLAITLLGFTAPFSWAGTASAAVVAAEAPSTPAPREVGAISDELFRFVMEDDYIIFNQLVARPESFSLTKPEPRFTDYSLETQARYIERYESLYQELRLHDRSKLDKSDRREYDLLTDFLKGAIASGAYADFDDPFMPSVGVHMELPLSLTLFNFRSRQDIDDYLELLNDAPRVLRQAMELARSHMDAGVMPNSHAIDSALEEALAYTAPAPANLLVSSFNDSLYGTDEPFASLSAEERDAYAARNLEAVEGGVIPAYKDVCALLEEEAKASDPSVTCASYPQGREYYASLFHQLGFKDDPAAAALYLDYRIDGMMDELSKSYLSVDFDAWERAIAANAPASATGVIELLRDSVGEDFPDIGPAAFTVSAASDDEVVAMFTAFYVSAPLDDLGNNRIVYYPQNVAPGLDLDSTLAHESFPGHLYQYNYHALSKPYPIDLIIGRTAYAEGYAVYVQEYGLKYLGLTAEQARCANDYEILTRAIQARADIGVNFEGWGLAETGEYLSGFGMQPYAEAIFAAVASTPTLCLPYGLGPLEFQDLRAKAQKALGGDFDAKAFHAAILDAGSMSFAQLEEWMQAWLADELIGLVSPDEIAYRRVFGRIAA
jgi:uncharacterized protein (DUF885 family)